MADVIHVNSTTLESMRHFVAKNDARHWMNGIIFTKSGQVIATDGHVAMTTTHDNKNLMHDYSVRIINQRGLSKYDRAEIDLEINIVRFFCSNIPTDIRMSYTKHYFNVPDVKSIQPTKFNEVNHIWLNASHISAIQKSSKVIDKKLGMLKIYTTCTSGVDYMEMQSPEGQLFKISIMPMRGE